MKSSLRVAFADDDPGVREYFAWLLVQLGHQVVALAEDGRKLLEQCRASAPDIVITDIVMPEMDGFGFTQRMTKEKPVPVIMITGYTDQSLMKRAESECILAYLVKPVKSADVQAAIILAMQRFQQFQALRQESSSLRQTLEDRKTIEKAKGIVMRNTGLSEADAFRQMQKLARNGNRKLVEIAQQILQAEANGTRNGVSPARQSA